MTQHMSTIVFRLLLTIMFCGIGIGLDSPRFILAADVDLPESLLNDVRHPEYGLRSWGIRDEERGAYFHILEQARGNDLSDLVRAANEFQQERRQSPDFDQARSGDSTFPVFYDLFQNEDIYHGKLVTLTGHLRRLISYQANENGYGIETLYEGWLYTDDSQHHPAIIIATSIPDGMPMGSDEFVLDHVTVTGYFFKMYGYEARDTNRFAPLILAQQFQWSPPGKNTPSTFARTIASMTVCAVILLAVVVWWWVGKQDRKSREQYRKLVADSDDAPTFENG